MFSASPLHGELSVLNTGSHIDIVAIKENITKSARAIIGGAKMRYSTETINDGEQTKVNLAIPMSPLAWLTVRNSVQWKAMQDLLMKVEKCLEEKDPEKLVLIIGSLEEYRTSI